LLKALVYAPDGLERVQVVLARLSLDMGRLVGQQARFATSLGLAISTLTAAAFVAIYSPDLIALLS